MVWMGHNSAGVCWQFFRWWLPFWGFTQCTVLCFLPFFRGIYCVHLQGNWISTAATWTHVVTLKMEAVCFSKTLELTKVSSVNPQKGDGCLNHPPWNPGSCIIFVFRCTVCHVRSVQTPAQTRNALFIMCILIPCEQLFIQTFHHSGNLIDEQSNTELNPLF